MVSEQGPGQGSADPAGLTYQLHFPGVGSGVSCLTSQGLSFLLCEMGIIKHLPPKGVRKMKQAKAPATKSRARLEGVGKQWLFLGGFVVTVSLKAQLGVPSEDFLTSSLWLVAQHLHHPYSVLNSKTSSTQRTQTTHLQRLGR